MKVPVPNPPGQLLIWAPEPCASLQGPARRGCDPSGHAGRLLTQVGGEFPLMAVQALQKQGHESNLGTGTGTCPPLSQTEARSQGLRFSLRRKP
jgi:hypothetical protein